LKDPRGRTPWSTYARSQPRGSRRKAEQEAERITKILRETGNWRGFIGRVIEEAVIMGKLSPYVTSSLWAEAIIRELEQVSIGDLVLAQMRTRKEE